MTRNRISPPFSPGCRDRLEWTRLAATQADVAGAGTKIWLTKGALITVTHEWIRQRGVRFGADVARKLRRRRPKPGDTWHLDEVFLRINSVLHYHWRAVDQHGVVLDILVQGRRNATAAKRFFKRLLTYCASWPRPFCQATRCWEFARA
jgi:hypothetical protein